jgi:erythronate-4-phosphate dehydrogenase
MQYLASALAYLSNKYNFDFSKKTIGIIGVGNVGSKVAKLASVLGMEILLNDPPRMRKESESKFVSIEKIKQNADIITFHVPLNIGGTDNTFHLCNDDFLNSLKPEAIIINSSRGEVVSNQSIKNALSTNRLKTAVLDVWENEPNIDVELLNLADIATAHIAGYSTEGKATGTAMAVQALSRHFGWGIDSWFPEQIPFLGKQEINIDCRGKSSQEIITEAITATYNIAEDDKKLRNSVEDFELLRGNYQVRREFSAYKINLQNDLYNNREKLFELGFG